jgi:hypothetical protein
MWRACYRLHAIAVCHAVTIHTYGISRRGSRHWMLMAHGLYTEAVADSLLSLPYYFVSKCEWDELVWWPLPQSFVTSKHAAIVSYRFTFLEWEVHFVSCAAMHSCVCVCDVCGWHEGWLFGDKPPPAMGYHRGSAGASSGSWRELAAMWHYCKHAEEL